MGAFVAIERGEQFPRSGTYGFARRVNVALGSTDPAPEPAATPAQPVPAEPSFTG
jgi:hypothetical protein